MTSGEWSVRNSWWSQNFGTQTGSPVLFSARTFRKAQHSHKARFAAKAVARWKETRTTTMSTTQHNNETERENIFHNLQTKKSTIPLRTRFARRKINSARLLIPLDQALWISAFGERINLTDCETVVGNTQKSWLLNRTKSITSSFSVTQWMSKSQFDTWRPCSLFALSGNGKTFLHFEFTKTKFWSNPQSSLWRANSIHLWNLQPQATLEGPVSTESDCLSP